jgi:HD-like signal output (HDOD) protein
MGKSTTLQFKAETKTPQHALLERIEALPGFPGVIEELLDLARQEYFTAKHFEGVVSKDQALVARLLKLVNSRGYCGSRRLETIPEGVVLVGLNNLRQVVYAIASEDLLAHDLTGYPYPHQGFWCHSLGTAMISRTVAQTSGNSHLGGEEAFVAGLMHDIGKLVIDDFLGPEKKAGGVTQRQEALACGLDHAELGKVILERWNLPKPIREAVRYHHDPNSEGNWRPGAATIQLADAVSKIWGFGSQLMSQPAKETDLDPFDDTLAALRLPKKRLQQILGHTRQKLVLLVKTLQEEE